MNAIDDMTSDTPTPRGKRAMERLAADVERADPTTEPSFHANRIVGVAMDGGRGATEAAGEIAEIIRERDELRVKIDELHELMLLAIPYIEESEQFNKPTCRTLSKKFKQEVAAMTAAIARAKGGEGGAS